MGLYKGRLWPFVLAALLGAGVVACDSPTDDESTEAEEETDDEEADDEEADEENDDEASEDDEQAAEDDSDLPFYATGPVATIDGDEIGKDEFNEMVRERVEQLPAQIPPQMVQQFKQQSVNFAVDKYLVDQVLEDVDIEVTDDDVREAFEDFKAQFGDEVMFEQQLEQMGMTEEEMLEGMEKDVKLEKYLSETHDLEVSDEEIREFFEEHEERFGREAEVHARHILIEVDADADEETEAEARERAEAIYEEATGGADFEELAREESEGPSAQRGGDLRYFTKDRMVPEFSEAAFAMEPGDISEPVRTQFGYHVINVVDTREASEPDFEEAAPDIERQLGHQKRAQVFHQFLEELKDGVDIEILDENIEVTAQAPEMPPMPHGGAGGPGGGGGVPQPVQPQEGGTIELDGEELQLQLGE